jgi:hypothetical protein
MKVYHGSYTKIERIDLLKGVPNRDFGRGFYVTKFRRQAEVWATRIGQYHHTQGVVTEFEFIDTAFTASICKIRRFESYNEEWLDFVVQNRDIKSEQPAHHYDIVEGPVANDQIQRRLNAFLVGQIPKAQFLQELSYHEPTHQICFCTLGSLLVIEPTEKKIDLTYHIEEIAQSLITALMLDRNIDETKAADLFFTSATFAQLADETTKLYQRPWQDIYEMLKQNS